jgi:hypothetical protein
MIRPEEVIDHRYLIWETTIDERLRTHEWGVDRLCSIQIRTQLPLLDKLLGKYRSVGWVIHSEQNDQGTLCRFMPAALLKAEDFDE